ncbi:nucleotide sugar dehydrogenase [Actinophytocola oryzae]|uniref:Nucleotide sugar dehydrogenase n=1 Tax=Actinophytocola oryzae TaxID=502181 RepID=A0A4R7VH73_9PSEU|nr:hypothetical protein [Actinophytocola oryzae]TDV48672.1 nucleotide sugar dehydrogenase [Actinophytocola oryzae]
MVRAISSFPDRRVCVLGLGHAGLTVAAVLADLGFQVLGVEPRADVRALVSSGKAPFREPGLAETLGRAVASGALRCTDRITADDADATVFVIAVGTPLDERGGMHVDMLRTAAEDVARHLSDDDLVIVRSTVGPGTTRGVVEPVLRTTGRRFNLAFCPERTMEGHALEELRRLPQIVGAVSEEAGERAERFFEFLTPAVVRVRDAETAEMVKLVGNVHRDVSFALGRQPFVQRVRRRAGRQLGEQREVLPLSEDEIVAVDRRGQPLRVQFRTDIVEPRDIQHGEGLSPPQRQSLGEQHRTRLPGGDGPGFRDHGAETV